MYARVLTHFLAIVLSGLALWGCFRPLVHRGEAFVQLTDLSGLSWLLYPLPLVIFLLAFLAMFDQVEQISKFYLPLGGLGFVTSLCGVYAGRELLSSLHGEGVIFGAGGLSLWLAYLGIAFLPFVRRFQVTPVLEDLEDIGE